MVININHQNNTIGYVGSSKLTLDGFVDVKRTHNANDYSANNIKVINNKGEWVGKPTNLVGPIGFTGSKGNVGFTGSKGGLIGWIYLTVLDDGYVVNDSLDGIIADTSGGSFSISLPENPNLGDAVIISDGGNWSENPLTVLRNGNTIENLEFDFIFDIGQSRNELIYDGSTWQLISNIGEKGYTGSKGTLTDDISDIVVLTQSQYDLISSPNSNTLYIING